MIEDSLNDIYTKFHPSDCWFTFSDCWFTFSDCQFTFSDCWFTDYDLCCPWLQVQLKWWSLLPLVTGQDETMISVALGYTSHLVAMIAQFLDVPLQCPVTCLGSRSQISDFFIDKLTDKESEWVQELARAHLPHRMGFPCALWVCGILGDLPSLSHFIWICFKCKIIINYSKTCSSDHLTRLSVINDHLSLTATCH